MLSRLYLWTSSPFLLMHLKPPFLGKHVNFARFILYGISFPGSFLYFLKKSLTIPYQPTLLQLSVDSGCFRCNWLSSGLQKCLCHLLQILLSFICLPFAGKTNNHVGFSWVCLRLIKEPLAWPLHWYQSVKVGLPGGSHLHQVHTPLLDSLPVPLIPNICVGS